MVKSHPENYSSSHRSTSSRESSQSVKLRRVETSNRGHQCAHSHHVTAFFLAQPADSLFIWRPLTRSRSSPGLLKQVIIRCSEGQHCGRVGVLQLKRCSCGYKGCRHAANKIQVHLVTRGLKLRDWPIMWACSLLKSTVEVEEVSRKKVKTWPQHLEAILENSIYCGIGPPLILVF